MSLTLPAGWMQAGAPGVDIAIMPLPGPQQSSPTFTVYRWGDTPFGAAAVDPRAESLHGAPEGSGTQGPDDGRGLPVAADRWVGEHWFGWRFLRVAPTVTGWPKAELRWLLWPVTEPRVDLVAGEPVLDATASCAVGDLSLLEVTFDSMAMRLPADWSPEQSADQGRMHQELRIEEVPEGELVPDGADAAETERARQALTLDDSLTWAGMTLFRVPQAQLQEALNGDRGELPALGRNGPVALGIVHRPESTALVTLRDAAGARTVLSLYRAGGLVAAVVEGDRDHPEEVRVGLYPAARSVELVLRATGVGPSDTRALTPDTVTLTSLLDRALDPVRPLPDGLSGDEQWAKVWDEPWALWNLSISDATKDEGAPGTEQLMMLTTGRRGTQRILRTEGEGQVRLEPAPSSEIFTDLLRRLGGPRVSGQA